MKLMLKTVLIAGLLSAIVPMGLATTPASAEIILETPEVAGIHPDSAKNFVGTADDTNSASYSEDALAPDASNADDSFHEDGMHIHVHVHHQDTSQPDNRSTQQQQLDWCRYSGFSTTASDLSGDSSLNEFQDLVANLQDCLDTHFPGDPANGTRATYIALQNESALLLALYPGSTSQAVAATIENGVTLPTQTWINWLQASAAAVPPVG